MDSHFETTVVLQRQEIELIDRLVASGDFASASEVVAAGLQALEDRNEEIDRWLRKEVVPVAMEMMAHPERGIPAKKVFDELRALARSRGADVQDDL